MKCIVRQQVELYGTIYRVGLRDIPAGHSCGDYFDACVKSGWISVQEVAVKPIEVAPAVDEVDADFVAVAVDEPEQIVEEKTKRSRKPKVVE